MSKERFVERDEIAFLMEVDPRTITNYVNKHTDFPSRVRGKSRTFPVLKCLAWKRNRLVADAISSMEPEAPTTGSLEEAERLKAIADAEYAQLRVKKFKADLVEASVVGAEIRRAFERVAGRLKATPGEFAPQILQPLTMPEAVSVLRQLVDTALAGLQLDFGSELAALDEAEAAEDGDQADVA